MTYIIIFMERINMMEEATVNKNKPQFDFDNNRNCFDFSIEINGDWVGGATGNPYKDDEEYIESYFEGWHHTEYDEMEFLNESMKKVKKFLNLKNKKEYEWDSVVYKSEIELYNWGTESYDKFPWTLKLTYCP